MESTAPQPTKTPPGSSQLGPDHRPGWRLPGSDTGPMVVSAWAGTRPWRCGPEIDVLLAALELGIDVALGRQALHVLREDPCAIVSVGEWSRLVGVSREHLTRSLSPYLQPHEFLLALRLSMAMDRLAEQNQSGNQPALSALGYSSTSHAFRVFRRRTGLTPTRFWRLAQERPELGAELCLLRGCPLEFIAGLGCQRTEIRMPQPVEAA